MSQRARDERPDRCKDNRAVQFGGRLFFGAANPGRAAFAGKLLMLFAAREYENLTAPMQRHLDRKIGAATISEHSQSFTMLKIGQLQRTLADDARAQQRRSIDIRESF